MLGPLTSMEVVSRLVNNWPLSRRVILHLPGAFVYYKNMLGNKQSVESLLDFVPAKKGQNFKMRWENFFKLFIIFKFLVISQLSLDRFLNFFDQFIFT